MNFSFKALLLYLFCITSLTFSEEIHHINTNIIDFESEPSSVVNHVNVISGNYVDFERDLTVMGPVPLTLERSIDHDPYEGSLKGGWNHNWDRTLTYNKNKKNHYKINYYGSHGEKLCFDEKETPAKSLELNLDPEQFERGVTNCGSGSILGRNHLKNMKMNYYKKEKECHLVKGDGSLSIFKKNKKDEYKFEKEMLPNFNYITIEEEGDVRLIKTFSAHNRLLNWLKIEFPKKMYKEPKVIVTGSDGRVVTYKYKKEFVRKGDETSKEELDWSLSCVRREDAPSVFYTFLQEDNKIQGAITGKHYPENRFLKIDYYRYHQWQKHPYQEKEIKIRDIEHPCVNKVMKLSGPIGKDATPKTMYRFVYEKEKKFKYQDKGVTTVYNAKHVKTIYKHDHQRLTDIIRHDSAGQVYSTEKMVWGANLAKPDEYLNCNLMFRVLEDKDGKRIFEKSYCYDGGHNVIEERIMGVICNKDEWNTCLIKSRYTQDKKNLLLSKQDAEKTIEIDYVPFTSKVDSKVHYGHDGLRRRQFFDYDDSAVVLAEITDDGTGKDRNDLSGVTERRIRRFELNDKGQPAKVFDYYFQDGQERLIRKEVNEYTKIGRLVKQSVYDANDQFAFDLEWDYDPMGNITRERNALGQEIHRRYDGNGNLVFEQGPSTDFHKVWDYDFMNRMISAKEVYQDRTLSSHFEYDLFGNRIKETDWYGNDTKYAYDFRGKQVEIRLPTIMNENGYESRVSLSKKYDVMGFPCSEIDAQGHQTYWKNNIYGAPTYKSYPDGSFETFHYDLMGHKIAHCDRNGVESRYKYDSFGRLTEQTVNSQIVQSARYSTFHMLSQTDAAGLITYYEYDGAGQKIKETRGTCVTCYQYDALGRLSKVVNNNAILEMKYDALNQIIEERTFDLDGKLTGQMAWVFDELGRKTHVMTTTDAGIYVDQKKFNNKGDLVWHKDNAGHITSFNFHYDYVNNVGQRVPYLETIDEMGQIQSSCSDVMGRVVKVEKRDFNGDLLQKKSQIYNSKSQCIRSIEQVIENNKVSREIVNEWEWDCMGQLTAVTEGVGSYEQKRTRYTYNSKGQKTEVIKPDGQKIVYAYDSFGRVEKLTALKNNEPTLIYFYKFNLLGNPVEVEELLTGSSTHRRYNESQLLVEEKLANDLVLRYEYNNSGQVSKTMLPKASDGGLNYKYRGMKLAGISRYNQANEIVAEATHDHYDLSGKIKRMTLPGRVKVQYEYDPLDRLLSINTEEWQQSEIRYDSAGNVLSFDQKDEENFECKFTHDKLHQLASEKGLFNQTYQHDSAYNLIEKNGVRSAYNALNQPKERGEVYDSNGNLSQMDGVEFFYDALDRLTEVRLGDVVVKYTYDAFNRRILSGRKKFLYQGQDEVGMVEDGELKEFRWLDVGLGKGAEIGSAVAMELNGQIYATIHDQQGNVSALYDLSGKIVTSYRTSAFGIVDQVGNQEVDSPWLFSSKRLDYETGFYYFGRRFYDPTTHRFTTADPIKFDGGSNLYAYCNNRPLSCVDLYGLFSNVINDDYTGAHLFADIINFPAKCIGVPLEIIGDHFIPVPLVREVFSGLGHVLSGKDLNEFIPSYSRNHSVNGTIKGDYEPKGSDFANINGICTTLVQFITQCRDYQEKYRDEKGIPTMHYSYNGTKGFITDVLIECFGQKLGLGFSPDKNLKKLTLDLINANGGPASDYILFLKAHSQGGLICNNLSYNLTPEYRNRIDLSTIGSASMVSADRFGKVTNYVSPVDGVPLTDAYGMFMSLFDNNSNIVFVPADMPFLDHAINSKPHQNATKKIVEGVKGRIK